MKEFIRGWRWSRAQAVLNPASFPSASCPWVYTIASFRNLSTHKYTHTHTPSDWQTCKQHKAFSWNTDPHQDPSDLEILMFQNIDPSCIIHSFTYVLTFAFFGSTRPLFSKITLDSQRSSKGELLVVAGKEFYRPDTVSVAQPTASKQWKEEMHCWCLGLHRTALKQTNRSW